METDIFKSDDGTKSAAIYKIENFYQIRFEDGSVKSYRDISYQAVKDIAEDYVLTTHVKELTQ